MNSTNQHFVIKFVQKCKTKAVKWSGRYCTNKVTILHITNHIQGPLHLKSWSYTELTFTMVIWWNGQIFTVQVHTRHTLYQYTHYIHCASTYTVPVHTQHTLYQYTHYIHCTSTHTTYIVPVHTQHTLYRYTHYIHCTSTHTINTVPVHAHYIQTMISSLQKDIQITGYSSIHAVDSEHFIVHLVYFNPTAL